MLTAGGGEMIDAAEKLRLCHVIKAEFAKHRWDTFVDEPPSMAQGGRGVVAPGCSICKTRLQTMGQFMDDLCVKVWRPSSGNSEALALFRHELEPAKELNYSTDNMKISMYAQRSANAQ